MGTVVWRLLVCAFPLLVAELVSVFLPIRVPDHSTTHEPVSYAKRPSSTLPYIVVVGVVIPPLAMMQGALFQTLSHGPAIFAHHLSDRPAYSLVPATLIAVSIAFPIVLHVHMWARGGDLDDAIARLDGRVPTWIYRLVVAIFPVILWSTVVGATLVNVAAVDTFLEIEPDEFRYSRLFDATTMSHAMDEVESLVIQSEGNKVGKRWLVLKSLSIELEDGTSLEALALIEPEQESEIVAAFERAPAFAGRVIREGDPRLHDDPSCRRAMGDEWPCAG